MSQTHSCPVCGRLGLPPNCGSCPQCDADLTCFQALDSLSSPAAVKAATPPKRRFPWAAIAILVTAVLLLLAGLAVSMKSRLSELDRQLAELKATKQPAALEQKHEPVAPPPKIAVEQPLLHPESKIQIDARLHISDEREAATQAGAAKQVAANQDALDQATKQEKSNEEPSVVSEQELPAEQAGEQVTAPDTAEENAGETLPAVSTASLEDTAELAATQPETPPVALTPTFRKHRVKPTVPAVMDASGTPAAEPQQVTPPVRRGGTFSYVVKDGENAWDIAERFYGNRKYYPVVLEQNPHIFLGLSKEGSVVRLFVDRREAAAFYQRRIEQRDGLLLWNYEVRPGETWRSIYARFFLPKYSGMVFYGDQEVTPGKTVRIILR